MLQYLKQETNMAVTENGATTYASSGSDCLDLFATIGALRNEDEEEIICRFVRAYTENADLAMKLLFYARDIRSGLGERRVFRIVFSWLAGHKPQSVKKNLKYVAEYGRYDDLLSLMGTVCEKQMMDYLKEEFDADMERHKAGEPVSLLAKWLPSINASNPTTVRRAKKIANHFHMRNDQYRKALSALRADIQIIENCLREKDYSFDYEKQTSRAMMKYRKAFIRNDYNRYMSFMNRVSEGEIKLHTGNVYPYEIVDICLSRLCSWTCISKEEEAVLDAEWKALDNFCGEENAIAVIDTSSSMYSGGRPLPATIARSLGIYFAERNKGVFHNHFLTFSYRPQLIEIKGETIVDKVCCFQNLCEISNTNIQATFDLILDTALKYKISQEEMPAKMVIISDMEFDCCTEDASITNFEYAKLKYQRHGYKLPEVVFWNVQSRNNQQPVRRNEQGVALISGVTPRIFSMVAGELVSPYELMMEVLENERYAKIVA